MPCSHSSINPGQSRIPLLAPIHVCDPRRGCRRRRRRRRRRRCAHTLAFRGLATASLFLSCEVARPQSTIGIGLGGGRSAEPKNGHEEQAVEGDRKYFLFELAYVYTPLPRIYIFKAFTYMWYMCKSSADFSEGKKYAAYMRENTIAILNINNK